MFISRKEKREIHDRLYTRAGESEVDRLRDKLYELQWRIESLEKHLMLTYEIKSAERVHYRKGGPERA